MTLWAQRQDKSDDIMVSMTYGPIRSVIVENYNHIKLFNEHLAYILAEIDREKNES